MGTKCFKSINLVCLLILCSCYAGCKKEDVFASCRSLIIDQGLFQGDRGDDFLWDDIRVVGDCIEMTIRYGGGCGKINANLVVASVIEPADISIRRLRLVFDDNDPCEASIPATFSFSLKDLRVPHAEEVHLSIVGWPEAIAYTY